MSDFLIRWMINRDIPMVVEIEKSKAQADQWEREDFLRLLRQKNVIGMVIEYRETKTVAGFMLYELMVHRITLLSLVVSPDYRRRKLGTSMVLKLLGKLSLGRRTKVVAEVRETNLEMQLFLRALGFLAVEVLRDYFEDSHEDAFVMQYKLSEEIPLLPSN